MSNEPTTPSGGQTATRGRPKKDPAERLSKQMTVRYWADEYEALTRYADERGTSVAEVQRAALAPALQRFERNPNTCLGGPRPGVMAGQPGNSHREEDVEIGWLGLTPGDKASLKSLAKASRTSMAHIVRELTLHEVGFYE